MKAKKKAKVKKAGKVSVGKLNLCAEHSRFMEIARQAKTVTRDHPKSKLGMLFMVNPMLAMKEMNIELNDSMLKRVKKTMKKSGLNEGNKSLYNKVKKGKFKIPWVDKVTFRKTKIADSIGG
jgi:methionine aminopeptidase